MISEYVYMDNNILILTQLRQYSDYETTKCKTTF